VRWAASVTLVMLFFSALALTLLSRGMSKSANADGYSHGTTSCLQGIWGLGVRLRLTRARQCEGRVSQPYLDIDVRDLPVSANKRIVIGDTNSAFRCQTPKGSCEQSLSGEIMFNHYEETSGKDFQTDGWYELKFSPGLPETGRFKVDCIAPCG
jgi:hypothetical protein